jgi:hypothetical protein
VGASAVLEPLALQRPVGAIVDPARQVVAYGERTVFFMDDSSYPEPDGFWVRPGVETTVVVLQPEAAAPLAILLRNAPIANEVEVTAGSWSAREALSPGQETHILAPPPGAVRASVLRIRATAGVRPFDLDRTNGDRRRLGVWVQFP